MNYQKFFCSNSKLRKAIFVFIAVAVFAYILTAEPYRGNILTLTKTECTFVASQTDLQEVARELVNIAQELQTAAVNKTMPPESVNYGLLRILKQLTYNDLVLFPNVPATIPTNTLTNRLPNMTPFTPPNLMTTIPANTTTNKTTPMLSVCPEVFINPTYGKPMYITGWVVESCENVPPLSEVVSIVINPTFSDQKNCSRYLQWILNGTHEYYANVSVYIAKKSYCTGVSLVNYPNASWVEIAPSASAGDTWTRLITRVITPYVFIARNVYHFTHLSRLERLISVIESNRGSIAVGGSSRNLTGHWSVGCFQTSMSNYILKYTKGYHVSRNECMFCDYMAGPFVAKTSIFRKIRLNSSLSEEMLFRDFFLQVKTNGYLTQSCPDSMHFANDLDQKMMHVKSKWVSLVSKWQLNSVVLPSELKHVFTCKESSISCKSRLSLAKHYLLPPCCLREYVKMLKEVHNVGLPYELNAGAVLGAVKMQGSLPWDNDIDLNFLKADYVQWRNSTDQLSNSNVTLEDHGYYFIASNNVSKIDMDFLAELTATILLPKELRDLPTLVEFDGEWVMGPGSPGLNARNRYGVEILQHAQSYLYFRKSNVNTPYVAGGVFMSCPHPKHHACLDHFAADGNIQFMIP